MAVNSRASVYASMAITRPCFSNLLSYQRIIAHLYLIIERQDMAHFEKKISSTEIYSGKVIRVTVDEVEQENGRRAKREFVHHNGGACIAALTDAGEIYMVRQFRYPIGKEILELPAGKLEPGEDPLEAAKRELEEECGLTAEHYENLGDFYPTVGYCGEIIYTYLATGLHATQMHPDEGEFLTPVKMPLNEACDMVMRGEICDGKTIAAILKLKLHLQSPISRC